MLRHNQISPFLGLKVTSGFPQVKAKSPPVSLPGPTPSSLHFFIFMAIPTPSFSLCSTFLLLSQHSGKYSFEAFYVCYLLCPVFSKAVASTSDFPIPWSCYQKRTISVRSMLASIWNWNPRPLFFLFIFVLHIYYQLTDYDSLVVYFMCHLLSKK